VDKIAAELHHIGPFGWGAVGVVGLLFMVMGGRRRRPVIKAVNSRGGSVRVLWRFGTGAHLDGQLRTDAGWWSAGHRDLTMTLKAPRWAYLPRATRAGIRWACLAVLTAFVWSEVTGSILAPVLLWAAVAGLLGWLGWTVPRQISKARFHRCWVLPVHTALAKIVGWDDKTRPERWVSIPRNFRDKGAVIRLVFPDGWPDTPQHRQAVNNAVTNNLELNLHELETAWWQGEHPSVTFTVIDAADRYLRVVKDQPTPNSKTSKGKRQRRAAI
jgi:hypothetical protein